VQRAGIEAAHEQEHRVSLDLDRIDGRIGEAWHGEAPDGSHVNVVVGRRGSPTAAAISALAGATAPGHLPVLACLGAGTVVRPATIIRNKTTLPDGKGTLARMTWGAAQLGVGQGVLDAVEQGLVPADLVDELVLLVAVWVDPGAKDETAVRLANRAATLRALQDALAEDRDAYMLALLAARDTATNGFYGGE
jgi:5,6,7,8-tetrahydromethanopterin hydro-lyase